MKSLILAVLTVLGIQGNVAASEQEGLFTIFLVRHAEKGVSAERTDDPPLSECGEMRAEFLAAQLADVDLERIYSTSYERTRETARPVAASRGMEIESYDPHELEEFSGYLLERGRNALVLGHSNTTGVLAGLLAGEAGEEFDEGEYDRLYLVTVAGAHRQVNLLRQAFRCPD